MSDSYGTAAFFQRQRDREAATERVANLLRERNEELYALAVEALSLIEASVIAGPPAAVPNLVAKLRELDRRLGRNPAGN